MSLLRWVAESAADLSAQPVVLWLLGAGTGGAILIKLLDGAMDWLKGHPGRSSQHHADALTLRDQAWDRVRELETQQADEDARHAVEIQQCLVRARILAEYASELRRTLIEQCGMTVDRIPPWPPGT